MDTDDSSTEMVQDTDIYIFTQVQEITTSLGLLSEDSEEVLALILSKPPKNNSSLHDVVMDTIDKVMLGKAAFDSNLQVTKVSNLQVSHYAQQNYFPLSQLPPYLYAYVLRFLTVYDLCNLAQVSKHNYSQLGVLHLSVDRKKPITLLSNKKYEHMRHLKVKDGADQLCRYLPALHQLEYLYICGLLKASSTLPKTISSCYTLAHLHLYDGHIKDDWFEHISKLSNLETLRVGGCNYISDVTIHFISCLWRLEDLYLGSIPSAFPEEKFARLGSSCKRLPPICVVSDCIRTDWPYYSVSASLEINSKSQPVYRARKIRKM